MKNTDYALALSMGHAKLRGNGSTACMDVLVGQGVLTKNSMAPTHNLPKERNHTLIFMQA